MQKLWNREKRERIEVVNQAFGTGYRTKPFDLKNPDDLEDLLLTASGKYADLVNHLDMIETLLEQLDESIEIYSTADWLKHRGNSKLIDAYTSVDLARSELEDELEKTREECIRTWQIYLTNAPTKSIRKLTALTKKDTAKAAWFGIDWDEVEIEVLKERPYTHREAVKVIGRSIKKQMQQSAD